MKNRSKKVVLFSYRWHKKDSPRVWLSYQQTVPIDPWCQPGVRKHI